MGYYDIQMERSIHAGRGKVYQILSDYQTHHKNILPKKYFKELKILAGGVGEGTKFNLEMSVGGKKHAAQMQVTEPIPGYHLQESDLENDMVTSFFLEEISDQLTRVKIVTRLKEKKSWFGKIEAFGVKMLLKKIYRLELEKLDAYAQKI